MGTTEISSKKPFNIAAWLFMGLMVFGVADAQAQFRSVWLDVGAYQAKYRNTGAVREITTGYTGMKWPAIQRHSSHITAKGLRIGVKNWTDADGKTWDTYVNVIGLRGPSQGLTFPVLHEVVSSLGNNDDPRGSQPSVRVEGGQSFDVISFVDRVDPAMVADKMIHTITNTRVGVTMERKVYAFSNAYHDQYHIIVYTYTNTGNVDGDEEIELEGQNLNEVLISRYQRVTGRVQSAWVTGGESVWGMYNMVDIVGDGHQEYGVDFRAYYVWQGWMPDVDRYNSLGVPVTGQGAQQWTVAQGDTVGRLTGDSYTARVVLYAEAAGNEGDYDIENFPPPRGMDADDTSPGNFENPELLQPHVWAYTDADGAATNRGQPMDSYYQAMLGIGPKTAIYPHHADLVEPDGNFATTTGDPSMGRQGGWFPVVTYGPYNLEFGESVRLVVADVLGGLSHKASVAIGNAYKLSGFEDSLHIAYDANGDGEITGKGVHLASGDEHMTKNNWVISSRDSVNKIFRKAIANYWSGFDIVQPPKPPKQLRVVGEPNRIRLEWDVYADGPNVDHWEIYRTARFPDNVPYELIAEVPAGEHVYNDTEAIRGQQYFYYVQAVGEPVTLKFTGEEGPAPTVQLRSGRYYSQTYTPAVLKRPPGTLQSFRIVPNPFNVGANPNLRYGREDRLGFLGIPGQSTITIYTELGELVTVIEHTDGSGDDYWNLTTDSRQPVVSGVYIAVVENTETGEVVQRQFTVIR